jgi:hypothetical protein
LRFETENGEFFGELFEDRKLGSFLKEWGVFLETLKCGEFLEAIKFEI